MSQNKWLWERNKWSELIGYLEKHYSEIINYNRRRRAGRTIALSLLRIVELNRQWQQLWFPAQAA